MSDARVMVIAPAPQLTVTAEPRHDAPEPHGHPGGQVIRPTRRPTSRGVEVTPGTLNVTRHGLGTGHIDAVQLTPIEKA